MSDPKFRVVQLSENHDKRARRQFNCGSEPLDSYFRQRVTQDIRRKVTRCFVAMADDGRIAGYYTLASASVDLRDLPDTMRKRLPRCPSVPAARLGRLAVDREFQKQGLGAALLADALARLCNVGSQLGVYALVVDAKDDGAANFYLHHGFIPTSGRNRILFLPLGVASRLLGLDRR